jgi:hypothetical protein
VCRPFCGYGGSLVSANGPTPPDDKPDYLEEARGRDGFVHQRAGRAVLPSLEVKAGRSNLIWVFVAVVAGGGIAAALYMNAAGVRFGGGAEPSPATTRSAADAPLPDTSEQPLALSFSILRKGALEELPSGSAIPLKSDLRLRLTLPTSGFVSVVAVSPSGELRTIYPEGTGGHASAIVTGKPHDPRPIAVDRWAPGLYRIYLLHRPTTFGSQELEARPDALRTPEGTRVVAFELELQKR